MSTHALYWLAVAYWALGWTASTFLGDRILCAAEHGVAAVLLVGAEVCRRLDKMLGR